MPRLDEINDRQLIRLLGFQVSIARYHDIFVRGELSYHSPHFQVYDKNKVRHDLQEGDIINIPRTKPKRTEKANFFYASFRYVPQTL